MGANEIRLIIFTAVLSLMTSLLTYIICNMFIESRKNKKRDKLYIFSILMQMRGMMDKEKIKALNLIQVVFSDNSDVLTAWKNYHTSLRIKGDEFTQSEIDESKKKELKLLEEMSKIIGYKKITWDIIDESYYPVYLSDEYNRILNQDQLIQGATSLVSQFSNMPNPKHSNGKKRK